jgi:predicted DNA-binding transcriptional regulator AlpA
MHEGKTTGVRTVGQAIALSAGELAHRVGVSLRHVRRTDTAGKLPRPVRMGRSVRWPVAEIDGCLGAGAPDRARWDAHRGVEGGHGR